MRHRDAAGEQRREHAARGAGLVHLLADDHRVGAVAASAADSLGNARAEQARLARLAMQLAGEVAGALPLVDVRQDLAFDEVAHRLSQLLRARGWSRCSREKLLRDVERTGAQPFAEPLGLRVEAGLVGDALAEDALDDEVDRAQVGQQVTGDGEIGCLG